MAFIENNCSLVAPPLKSSSAADSSVTWQTALITTIVLLLVVVVVAVAMLYYMKRKNLGFFKAGRVRSGLHSPQYNLNHVIELWGFPFEPTLNSGTSGAATTSSWRRRA